MAVSETLSSAPRALPGMLQDRFVHAAILGFVLLASTLALPSLRTDPAVMRTCTTIFLVLASTASLFQIGQIRQRIERAFWRLIAAANGFWIAAALIRIFYGDVSQVYAITDLGFSLYYICLVLVVERQPHAPRLRAQWVSVHLPAIAVFVFGLFAYFILIPARFNPDAYQASLTSAYLYATIDLFLTGRLLFLARGCRSVRWRRLYLALAIWPALMVAGDVAANVTNSMAWGNYFYALAILALTVVARLRHHVPEDDDEANLSGTPPEPGAQSLVYALVFPIVHLGIYRFGFDVLDIPSQRPRETLVFFWILILGTVAVIQHYYREREAKKLAAGNAILNQELAWRERLEVETEALIAELEEKNAELERLKESEP